MKMRILGLLAVVAVAATVVVGWRLPPTEEQAGYARLIAVHPALAWTAYLAFAVVALGSLLYLIPATRARRWDRLAGASGEVGVVFTALMLITGSIWGKPTWGTWWVWDARLTLSALMLALLFGYVALRKVDMDVDRRAVISAVTGVAAVLIIPINHFAVTWWRTQHQNRSAATLAPSSNLDGSYIRAMFLGMVAMTLSYAWLLVHRIRVEALEEERQGDELSLALAERRAEGASVAGPSEAEPDAAVRS